MASWQCTHRQPRGLNISAAKPPNTANGSLAPRQGKMSPQKGHQGQQWHSPVLSHPIKPALWLQFQGPVETGTNSNLPKGELSGYFLWRTPESTGDNSLTGKERGAGGVCLHLSDTTQSRPMGLRHNSAVVHYRDGRPQEERTQAHICTHGDRHVDMLSHSALYLVQWGYCYYSPKNTKPRIRS